jgi:AcrR family transcriptional regulator
MQAIADRSASSIGALYNYFPDKRSIAVTLLRQYSEEMRVRLNALMAESDALPAVRFAQKFIDLISAFVQERPAYLNLLSEPIRSYRDPAARKALRVTMANALRKKNPSLTAERAWLKANVAIQIVKGMVALYQESEARSRPGITEEFRSVLTAYLESVLTERK